MKQTTLSCLVGVLAAGCTLGESPPEDPSPYDDAAITVATPVGAADGETPIEVTITGTIGAKLTLVLTGGGAFVGPDSADAPDEKTVFLTDVNGVGQATAGVVSTQVGTVAVAFKPDPLRSPRELEFVAIRMAAGPANESRFLPGLVEHRVCIAVNSPTGELHASNLVGGEEGGGSIQATATISPIEPTGLSCPTTTIDQVGWKGYAVMLWHTFADRADVDLTYVGPGDAELALETVTLMGLAFPGYQVSAAVPQVGLDYLSVDITVAYAAAGELSSTPAADVEVAQRFIPSPGPDFLGSSSGDTETVPTTDSQGVVTMFFDPNATGTYAWFVQLSGGMNVQLDDLEIP